MLAFFLAHFDFVCLRALSVVCFCQQQLRNPIEDLGNEGNVEEGEREDIYAMEGEGSVDAPEKYAEEGDIERQECGCWEDWRKHGLGEAYHKGRA